MFYNLTIIFFVVVEIIILVRIATMSLINRRNKVSETKKTNEYHPIINDTKELTIDDRYRAWGIEPPSSFR